MIASVFIAIIGLLSWRAKLWLDLRADKAKFLQQKKLERGHEREHKKARYAALAEKREQFATRAQTTLTVIAQDALWVEVREWMESEDLLGISGNRKKWSELGGTPPILPKPSGASSFPPRI